MNEGTTISSNSGEKFIRCRKLARVLAMQYLYDREARNDWSELQDEERTDCLELVAFLKVDEDGACGFEPSEKDMKEAWRYASKLVNGVCGCHEELDEYISQAATNWKLPRIGNVDRAILRLAVYEMLKVDKVSVPTAINEAVELSKSYGQKESPMFINGVLDKIREMAATSSEAAAKE